MSAKTSSDQKGTGLLPICVNWRTTFPKYASGGRNIGGSCYLQPLSQKGTTERAMIMYASGLPDCVSNITDALREEKGYLKGIIISHDDNDHIGGLKELLSTKYHFKSVEFLVLPTTFDVKQLDGYGFKEEPAETEEERASARSKILGYTSQRVCIGIDKPFRFFIKSTRKMSSAKSTAVIKTEEETIADKERKIAKEEMQNAEDKKKNTEDKKKNTEEGKKAVTPPEKKKIEDEKKKIEDEKKKIEDEKKDIAERKKKLGKERKKYEENNNKLSVMVGYVGWYNVDTNRIDKNNAKYYLFTGDSDASDVMNGHMAILTRLYKNLEGKNDSDKAPSMWDMMEQPHHGSIESCTTGKYTNADVDKPADPNNSADTKGEAIKDLIDNILKISKGYFITCPGTIYHPNPVLLQAIRQKKAETFSNIFVLDKKVTYLPLIWLAYPSLMSTLEEGIELGINEFKNFMEEKYVKIMFVKSKDPSKLLSYTEQCPVIKINDAKIMYNDVSSIESNVLKLAKLFHEAKLNQVHFEHRIPALTYVTSLIASQQRLQGKLTVSERRFSFQADILTTNVWSRERFRSFFDLLGWYIKDTDLDTLQNNHTYKYISRVKQAIKAAKCAYNAKQSDDEIDCLFENYYVSVHKFDIASIKKEDQEQLASIRDASSNTQSSKLVQAKVDPENNKNDEISQLNKTIKERDATIKKLEATVKKLEKLKDPDTFTKRK